MVDIVEIIERIKCHTGKKKDVEISKELGVTHPRLTNWKKRGTIPWVELSEYAIKQDVSFDWLFRGIGTPEINIVMEDDMGSDDWQMKLLFEQLSQRMNDQQKHIDNLGKLVTRLTDAIETNSANTKNETEKLWKVTNDDRVQTRADITILTEAVVRIKGRMGEAAQTKDITKLGELEAVSG
jgi:hypothetical protein